MRERKPIIGLSGGIGAGKSRVAAEFARIGCLVIDSDKLNTQMLARPEVIQQLRNWWGDKVIQSDGTPDRRRIAEVIFSDPEQKKRLEGLLHPLIAAAREGIITDGIENQAVKAIILDSPLLFESSLAERCDKTIFVEASLTHRLERLRQARGWDADELSRRQRQQFPLSEKRSRADFVIPNEGTVEELRSRVSEILEQITGVRTRRL